MSNFYDKKITKIFKENYQKNNSLFKEKILNFLVDGYGNFSKEFVFKSNDNFANLNCVFNSVENAIIEVILNGVKIVSKDIVGVVNLSLNLYVKSENILKFNINTSELNNVNILTNIKINTKNYQNNANKILFINNNYFCINNNILTISNSIMPITYDKYNKNNDNNDKYFDINYNYNNNTNIKEDIVGIYYNNSLKFKSFTKDIEYGLSDNIEDCCILQNFNNDKKYILAMLKNGEIFIKFFNSEMMLLEEKNIGKINGKKLLKIRSITSENFITFLLVQDASKCWHLIKLNNQLNSVEKVRSYKKCDDLSIIFREDKILIFEYYDEGVEINIFNNFDLTEKVDSIKFLNVLNVFYFDKKLYLSNLDNVQIIDME